MVGESCDDFAIRLLDHLIYLSRYTYLSRPGDSERTFLVFESSCRLLTISLTTKGKGNPATNISTTQRNNKQNCLFVSTLIL